jgi:acetyltransferase-like isoleucine patch superfamily enzyme
MSVLQGSVEALVRKLKRDPSYRIVDRYTDRQLATVLWHRGVQFLRGLMLTLGSRHVESPVFCGRRVVVEHAYALVSRPGLILEDGVSINAFARDGVRLGHNVTIARNATLACTGVLARLGVGIVVGDRSAIGSGSFIGGQGGVTIGDDVILGPGVRIFSENHRFDQLDTPIRSQGEEREGVIIGNDCWIGAGVTILAGVSVGDGCVIAAGAIVTKDIAPWMVAAGIPARAIRSRRPEESQATAPQDSPSTNPEALLTLTPAPARRAGQ